MYIGNIDPNRLKEIPPKLWASHEFCFHLHDLIAQHAQLTESLGLANVSIKLRDETDIRTLESSIDPFEFLASTGRTDDERRLMVNHVCRALLPDMLHFIHGALIAMEKRKFTMAFALLRKPLKEGLPLLALMCADEQKFFHNLKDDPRNFFDGQAFNANQKKEVIASAIEKCDGMEFANADFLYSILFDYDNDYGLAGLFDKATHLFTKRSKIATENYNINFIFKDPRDNDIYELCYGGIAYSLLFIHLLQIELMSRMKFAKEGYLTHLVRSSVGAYECIFGRGRSRMTQLFNDILKDFMKCTACGEKIRLRKSTAARFFVTEILQCSSCNYEQNFPLSWLSSRASSDGEDT